MVNTYYVFLTQLNIANSVTVNEFSIASPSILYSRLGKYSMILLGFSFLIKQKFQ